MLRLSKVFLLLAVGLSLSSCSVVKELAAVRQVDFSLDGTQNVSLAGVNIDPNEGYDQIGVVDLTRLAAAAALGELMLDFNLLVGAVNPADNMTTARLTRLDWTLWLADKETISGMLPEAIRLEPGVPTTIPINMRLDLFEFFEGQTQEIYEVARSVAAGNPSGIRLSARPYLETPLGTIPSPGEIDIYRTEH